MARLEEILGLPHRNGDGPVNKARGVIYNWAQVSNSLIFKAHSSYDILYLSTYPAGSSVGLTDTSRSTMVRCLRSSRLIKRRQ
jgi:hypothetical protein